MLAVEINASPIGLLFAFFGGMISILSPCVLPILPGMMGVISGMSLNDLKEDKKLGRRVLVLCSLFTIGFSFVYVVIGLTTTGLSQFFLDNSQQATRIGGIVLICLSFIFLLSNVFSKSIFNYEKRPFFKQGITGSGAVLTGAAFGFGWSPCLGPILAGVLAYASTENNIFFRVLIILTYCIGLCVAMTGVVYLSLKQHWFIGFIKRHMTFVMVFTFLLMFAFGVILATNNMTWLTAKLSSFMDVLGLDNFVTIG